MNKNDNDKKNKAPSNGGRACAIVFGGLFILLAVLYILKFTGIYPGFTLLHLGTLPMLLFIPMLIAFVAVGPKPVVMIFLLISLYMFFACQQGLYFLWKFFVPAVMLIVGVVIFGSSRIFRYRKVVDSESGSTVYFPIAGAFLCRTKYVHTDMQPLHGAIARAVLGASRLDISGASLADDVLVDVFALLGTCEVKVPEYSNVVIGHMPICGVIRGRQTGEVKHHSAPTIHIRSKAIFGVVEISRAQDVNDK